MSMQLSKIEKKVLESWGKNNTFEKTVQKSKERTKDQRPFNFYDGPPFATGKPHHGHLLAGTIKDVICRFMTLNGCNVPRMNGWDTHGLPIEQLVEKELGIKNKEQILAMGISKFNSIARQKVLECASDWEVTISRLGRWIDFKNSYKTMDFEFMNAVWAVFKVLFDKGLIYNSLVPMPFSTGCGSCLSHFEAKSNYQDVQDPSIVLRFLLIDLLDDKKVNLLVWTTTPYSLTANLALCINSKVKYVLLEVVYKDDKEDKEDNIIEYCVIAELSIDSWKQKDHTYNVIRTVDHLELIGKKYIPPYNFSNDHSATNAFTVIEDSYVKSETGTGIVHLAPGLGDDDYRICLREKIINPHKPSTIVSPIDDTGALTVSDDRFKGKYVKVADKEIIKDLNERGLLWSAKTIVHSYPLCYRTDTPLIQKSIKSWFINVHSTSEKLSELNDGVYWVPSVVGEHRFKQWLKEPHDWSFGRNRFWGTPVPLWVSDDFEEVICVGSVTELEHLTGLKPGSITDLHLDQLDHLKIYSKKNPGQQLKRIDDVFDCWFESGSMPYGKYAVENGLRKDEMYKILSQTDKEGLDDFLKYFPADFIAEGLDQTRGWFYTLLVLSTILFEKSAYQNVIVNGLILAESKTNKWEKMSKRHGNYTQPDNIMDEYGADSLRLYFLDSPVVKGEPLKFKADGVEQKGRFLVQWLNCFQFLEQEVKLLEKESGQQFELVESHQIYDQWILGELSKLFENVTGYYSKYLLYLAVPELIRFEELFSRWYLNLAKPIMKCQHGVEAQRQSLSTFHKLLKIFSILISPITPFMSEHIYDGLSRLVKGSCTEESVHMELLSNYQLKYDHLINQRVSRMVEVVMVVRSLKDAASISPRHKSKTLVLKHLNQEFLNDVKGLEKELRSVIKVDQIEYQVMNASVAELSVTFNYGLVGKIAKKEVQNVLSALNSMNVMDFIGKEEVEVLGFTIDSNVWNILPVCDQGEKEILMNYTRNGLLVLLAKEVVTTETENEIELILKKIQKAKKDSKLKTYQKVDVYLQLEKEDIKTLIEEEMESIKERLRSNLYFGMAEEGAETIGHWDCDGYQFDLKLNKLEA
jgi:isoleucyl-tRNA synthetase